MFTHKFVIGSALLILAQPAFAQTGSPVQGPVDSTAQNQREAAGRSTQPEKPKGSFLSDFTFKPRGRILYDIVNIDAPSSIVRNDLGWQDRLRRVRFGASGQITTSFGYKVEADIANSDFVFTDAFIDFKKDGLTIQLGQHNNFQSLDELTSSNDSSFIERAAFTDAFGFERKLGLSAQYSSGDLLGQIGVFTDNLDDLNNDGSDGIGVDGRLVFAPKMGGTQLHFGASAHWRDLGENDTTLRYRQRPLVNQTSTRFINTGNLANAESETSFGLEAAAIAGRFHVSAETHWVTPGLAGPNDPTFFGGAIEAGFYLTDHKREYKGGIFKSPKIEDSLGNGGIGAVQVNVRYDYLDLNDNGVVGGKQNGYMASLIWTPIKYVRFMVNYARLNYDDAVIPAGTSRDYSVNVFGFRTQLSY